MNAFAAVDSDAAASDAAAASDVQFYRATLHAFIEMGVELGRDVCRQAKVAPLADATVMFERVALAVRRTIALAQRLDKPVAVNATRRLARQRIIRDVEDRILRTGERPERAECLRSELYERMDRPELEEALDLRPAEEIIADICRDLGIAAMSGGRGWPRRTPADVIALCARAARPREAAAWDARVGDARVGDASLGDARLGDARVGDARGSDEAAGGAPRHGVAGDDGYYEAKPAVPVERLLQHPSRDHGSG